MTYFDYDIINLLDMGKLADFLKRDPFGDTRYILSIDGGGMRGIIPAYIIGRLDELIRAEGDDRPFYSHFDLIAGTSTGGLLAIGLSCPQEGSALRKDEGRNIPVYRKRSAFRKPVFEGMITREVDPASLEDIYLENGSRIFPSSGRNILTHIGQFFSDKYDVRPFENFLKDTLSDLPLDSLKVPTVLVSFSTTSSSIYVFRSWDSHGFLLREAARATTAAPMYFPAAVLEDRTTGERLVLSDGGLGANNPALVAYVEAQRLYPEAKNFKILSLSTCKNPYSFDPTKTTGGVTGWVTSITRLYSSAQENSVGEYLKCIKNVEYTRIYSRILDKRIALDDTSPESLGILRQKAEQVYANQEDELKAFARALAAKSVGSLVKLSNPLLLECDEVTEGS